MARALHSSSWYRVAGLRPRLRAHVRTHRQRFRGETWYVLQDPQSGRFHRLSPAAHYITCMMDGRRTVEDIWHLAQARYPEDPPIQDDVIRLLAQFHAGDLLIGGIPPNMEELTERADRHARQTMMQYVRNPLSLRFPLIDPDTFLTATMPFLRFLFGPIGLVLWLAVVTTGAVVAAMNWNGLTHNIADQVLSAENIILLLVAYPLVKALHELGHAYATKRWGGEVHEMGVMLLVFMPIPYVDASASSAFANKWQRALVGGAGILVELFVAAIAVIVWASVEPGAVRALAFSVALIGGVSTVLFNGNPLLRFDGYYVLADLLEIPNLGQRSGQYITYLVQRHLFRQADAQSPVSARGEGFWFFTYAITSFVYRIGVMLAIALFIGTQFFLVGIALALWTLFNGLALPILKGLRYVLRSPKLQHRRRRAVGVTAAAFAAALFLLLVVPVPYATLAQGVVMVPEASAVRAPTDGHVARMLAVSGSQVAAGQPLLQLGDPVLAGQAAALAAEREAYQLRLLAVRMTDRVQAGILREQVDHVERKLEHDRRRLDGMWLTAASGGRFVLPHADDLPGRFVHQGDLLGYVIGDHDPVVRIVVPQSHVDLVRQRVRRADVRFADAIDRVLPGAIIREVPSAVAALPSLALSTRGGGSIALDPTQSDAPRALETQFQFDVRVAPSASTFLIGNRAHVRFDHGYEPIAWRLARSLRQLFLRQFNV